MFYESYSDKSVIPHIREKTNSLFFRTSSPEKKRKADKNRQLF